MDIMSLIEEIIEDKESLNERYIEVPDPDNINETILIHKGFEEFLDYDDC